jgi:hypothetical protein
MLHFTVPKCLKWKPNLRSVHRYVHWTPRSQKSYELYLSKLEILCCNKCQLQESCNVCNLHNSFSCQSFIISLNDNTVKLNFTNRCAITGSTSCCYCKCVLPPVKLINHYHLMSRLRMHGTLLPHFCQVIKSRRITCTEYTAWRNAHK